MREFHSKASGRRKSTHAQDLVPVVRSGGDFVPNNSISRELSMNSQHNTLGTMDSKMSDFEESKMNRSNNYENAPRIQMSMKEYAKMSGVRKFLVSGLRTQISSRGSKTNTKVSENGDDITARAITIMDQHNVQKNSCAELGITITDSPEIKSRK